MTLGPLFNLYWEMVDGKRIEVGAFDELPTGDRLESIFYDKSPAYPGVQCELMAVNYVTKEKWIVDDDGEITMEWRQHNE